MASTNEVITLNLIPEIVEQAERLKTWRQHIHAHPEMAFKEYETAAFVAERLREFGLTVHEGIAGTGVVGTLTKGGGNRAIGLRADLDALPIVEANTFSHASKTPGVMHACGHDGHTCMLLGAAAYLAKAETFSGTVHFIFQPAEENEGGAKTMIEAGLFEQFPVEAVYGMHNIPGIPVGHFAVKPGPMMAAFDIFDITVVGRGGHAAIPQQAIDPILIGTKIVEALQTLVAREINPQEPAVLSVTQFEGGDAYNVIPDQVRIAGCTRCFSVRSKRNSSTASSASHPVLPAASGQPLSIAMSVATRQRSTASRKPSLPPAQQLQPAAPKPLIETQNPPWALRILLICCLRNQAATSGLVMATVKAPV